jgi:hypothetical protein
MDIYHLALSLVLAGSALAAPILIPGVPLPIGSFETCITDQNTRHSYTDRSHDPNHANHQEGHSLDHKRHPQANERDDTKREEEASASPFTVSTTLTRLLAVFNR